METLGNTSLLDRKKIGYFASSKIASLSVLPTLDWAAEVAQHENVTIISGFHSKMEREVLDFLLRGKCGIVCVLARSIYKKIPDKFHEAYSSGRVLFVSNERESVHRAARDSAARRNAYIASICDSLVFSSVTTESSLYHLTQSSTPTTIL